VEERHGWWNKLKEERGKEAKKKKEERDKRRRGKRKSPSPLSFFHSFTLSTHFLSSILRDP
jgi:hypothetical protein